MTMVWLTKAQREAVHKLYHRNKDGSTSYRAFRRRVVPGICWKKNEPGSYVVIDWCRLCVGIELDGHTHT
jgi:hypothetical protein